MKFSAFTTALNAISLKMMGISSPAQNQIGAIGSNDLIQGANSFWETLGVILWRTVADIFITIWEMLVKLVYAIAKWLLTIIDFLFIFIRQLIGLNTDYASIEDISQSDMIFRFVFNDTVIRVIRAMLGFAVVLLILFCIIAILKSEFEYAQRGGNNSKKQIMVRTLKSIFLMVLVPIISIGAVVLSNAILKTLYMATAGGTDVSMGAQIFVASGYNANAYRRYANNNKKIPITFNFEEVTESDNVTGWGNDGSIAELDEALQAFKSSDVWNRGLTTFLMFYTDAFLDMDSVDKLNSIAKAEGKTSNYHAVYDEGIFTRAEEYYVMADVMDYSLKNHQAIYFKTAEEIYESFYNTLNLAPSEVRNQMGNYMPISKTADGYSFSVFFSGDSSATTYTHIEGETDEAKGAVFMIALEKEIEYNNRVYTYYYPLLSTEDNFATDYYARTRQPVVAKGLFEKGENPTAIKVEDGVVKFYRDDLNVPTLVDFFPTISYELPEGVTQDVGMMIIKAGFQAVTGVSADEFIPYVYYSFDIFNLFTKKSYNLVQLDSGYLALDYNFSQRSLTMENLYKMFDFNIVILVFASIIILGMLIKIIFGLALRVLDVTLLAITYPAVLSTYPLDGGDRFKGWVDMFIKKLVSIYGVVVGVNIVLLLFPAIDNLNLITPTMIQQAISLHWLPSSVTADFLNFLVEILFMLVAFTSIQSAAKIIESLITSSKTEDVGGIISDGEMVVNDLKKLPQTIGNVVTGKIILDVGKKAIDTATSFIPGSAIVADIHDRVKHKKDQAGMQSSIDSLKDDMKSGKSDVLGGENIESPQGDNGGEQATQETPQETSQGAPQEAPQETSQDAGAENAEQAVDQQVDQSVDEMSEQVEESMGLSEASGGSGVSGADVAGDVADVADTMFSPTSEEFRPARTTADYEREMYGDQPQDNYEAPTSPVGGGAPNSKEANATLEATPDDNEDKANEAEETNSNEEEQNADPNSEAPAENARGAGNSETETQRNNNDDNNNDTGGGGNK